MNTQVPAILASLPRLQSLYRQLPVIVSLLLVFACAHALVKITWMLLPEQEIATTPTRTPRVSATPRTSTAKDIRRLTGAHLFGEAGRVAAPEPTKAPETRLNLVLRGVIAADPMVISQAIIAQGRGKNEDAYAVGDKMPGGVIVKEIYAEHVILERGGRLETLPLVKDEDVGDIITSDDTNSNLPPASPGEALRNIRNVILKNPTSFGEYALPVVVRENGKQVGYRLAPQQRGELLSQIGLQPDDVITEINGIKLNNPQNGIGALRKLSRASTINIKVRRHGAEVPMNIQLQ